MVVPYLAGRDVTELLIAGTYVGLFFQQRRLPESTRWPGLVQFYLALVAVGMLGAVIGRLLHLTNADAIWLSACAAVGIVVSLRVLLKRIRPRGSG